MWKRNQVIEHGGRRVIADVYTSDDGFGCAEIRIKGPAPTEPPKKPAVIPKPVSLPEGTPTLDEIRAGLTNEEYARIARHTLGVLEESEHRPRRT